MAPPSTVRELLHWSYGNLAMAHAAVEAGEPRYTRLHYMIRAKLQAGLKSGRMKIGSLVADDRLKMVLPQVCAYCGSEERLSVDHLIATSVGGPETGDNIVWACRTCNSSKNATDLLVWYREQDRFPPLFVLRRYLKLAYLLAEQAGQLETPPLEAAGLPFAVEAIPIQFPPPSDLMLYVKPVARGA